MTRRMQEKPVCHRILTLNLEKGMDITNDNLRSDPARSPLLQSDKYSLA